jgi:hypothetical protein
MIEVERLEIDVLEWESEMCFDDSIGNGNEADMF